MLTDYCDIESCFDLELEDYKNLVEIETGPLTELVCKYRDFESVLHYAGTMRYDVETLAGVCGLSQEETRRQLLEKELVSVLNYLDYWQPEETKKKYMDIYNAYADCLMSELPPRE